METQIISNQYNISSEFLTLYFDNIITGVNDFELWSISVSPAGHGHYSIACEFILDGLTKIINTKTSNMHLIDAWKSGMSDMYEDGDDGFDNWDEVTETMLNTIDIEGGIEYLEF